MIDQHLGHCTEHARDLVKKMLVKDPDKRPTAAQVLEHTWLMEDA